MNRFFHNFKTGVIKVKDASSFLGMMDLGLATYSQRLIVVRGVRQYHHTQEDRNTEAAMLAQKCLEIALCHDPANAETGRKVVVSPGRPNARDALVKASVAIPVQKHYAQLTLSYEKSSASKVPLVWLDIGNFMNRLEHEGYDLDTAKTFVEACKPIDDF